MADGGARPAVPRPPCPGSALARAREYLQVAEFHGWLSPQPPEARAAAALAGVQLGAIVVAFAMGNAQEP